MHEPSQRPETLEIATANEAETDRLGLRLAATMTPGLVVALVGELGAGKTRLVRSIAVALGADPAAVNSPTFVLVQRYAARIPLVHFDTYRLRDADEFADLGPEENFGADVVCFVEWADRVDDALPDDHLRIEIEATGPTARRFRLEATGPKSRRALELLV